MLLIRIVLDEANPGESRAYLREGDAAGVLGGFGKKGFLSAGRAFQGGEYGDCFIGLQPVNSTTKQPFHFGEYKGVFRWYSYAIHGTQDQSRIGKCVTGGCINVGAADLAALMAALDLNDRVAVQSRS
ncbi:MAG: L,D-transpeptidase [Verrucomicrobiales bacterium]|nr:L,D-transpeptidase [Verrucomicrobiales bacterium]